jgi:hypothetical protein
MKQLKKILMLWQRDGLTVVPGISVSAMDENFGPLNQRSIVRWALKMILKLVQKI